MIPNDVFTRAISPFEHMLARMEMFKIILPIPTNPFKKTIGPSWISFPREQCITSPHHVERHLDMVHMFDCNSSSKSMLLKKSSSCIMVGKSSK